MQRKKLEIRFAALVALAFAIIAGTSFTYSGNLYAAPKMEAEAMQSAPVNINKAGAEELQTIRGIGPVLSERILAYRQEHGAFKQPEDLSQVHGIGGAKFQKIKDQITV